MLQKNKNKKINLKNYDQKKKKKLWPDLTKLTVIP